MKITELNMSNMYDLYKIVRITVITDGHNLLTFIKILTENCITSSTKNRLVSLDIYNSCIKRN